MRLLVAVLCGALALAGWLLLADALPVAELAPTSAVSPVGYRDGVLETCECGVGRYPGVRAFIDTEVRMLGLCAMRALA